MARFRLRFNQCEYNIKLNDEERGGFKQVKLIEYFIVLSQKGALEDIKV